MTTTAEDSLNGLRTYFFDDVFNAHRKDYPAGMTLEQFAEHLSTYRDGMNSCNDCSFPAPAPRTVIAWHSAYLQQFAAMPRHLFASSTPPSHAGSTTSASSELVKQAEYSCEQAVDALERYRERVAALHAELAAAELVLAQLEYAARTAMNTAAQVRHYFMRAA